MEQVDFDRLRLSNSNGIRIVSTKSLSPDTEYLTLSHRWGSPPTILLSKKTPFHLADDVSPHLLKCAEATVFQHAIHVTRCLGFRYIWIDALCIMQDDAAEKKAEIMRMDDIYFNSKLNISAAEADAFSGLVFTRKPLVVTPCVTMAKVPGIQEEMSLYVFGQKLFLRQWEKPLSTRGWVFQERILSPRIVHFTEDQVFWECWSLKASEVLPEGVPGEKETDWMYGDLFNESIGMDPTTLDVRQIKSRWYDLVESYSRMSLSFADDHLLAISAVAKRFCSAMRIDPSEYLAGMWKDDLPLYLDWFQEPIPGRSGPAETRPDLEMEYAPSWSWASVMASVSLPDRCGPDWEVVATTEVFDIDIAIRSQNFFDGTDFCLLRLRGPICKFFRYLQDDGTTWIHVSDDKAFSEEYIPFLEGRSICIAWDTARSFKADDYFLLKVARASYDTEPAEDSGLVLIRTAERGTYKRVGIFRILVGSEYLGSKLEYALKGEIDTLGKEDYLELCSDGKYIINVI